MNNECPKDSFPLPHIDQLIDFSAGHELLSFFVTYSGYNQIKMDTKDKENKMDSEDEKKTSFITDRETYFYKVIPFSLKMLESRIKDW